MLLVTDHDLSGLNPREKPKFTLTFVTHSLDPAQKCCRFFSFFILQNKDSYKKKLQLPMHKPQEVYCSVGTCTLCMFQYIFNQSHKGAKKIKRKN